MNFKIGEFSIRIRFPESRTDRTRLRLSRTISNRLRYAIHIGARSGTPSVTSALYAGKGRQRERRRLTSGDVCDEMKEVVRVAVIIVDQQTPYFETTCPRYLRIIPVGHVARTGFPYVRILSTSDGHLRNVRAYGSASRRGRAH